MTVSQSQRHPIGFSRATILRQLLVSLTLPVAIFADVSRADPPNGLAPAGAVFVPSRAVLNYVEQPAIRNELAISADQQAQIEKLRLQLDSENAAGRNTSDWHSVEAAIERSDLARILLGKVLTPAQVERHREIVMQHLLIRFGLVQLMNSGDLAETLQLDAGQKQALQTIFADVWPDSAVPEPLPRGPQPAPKPARSRTDARRHESQDAFLSSFTNPDLRSAGRRADPKPFDDANARISRLLTPSQKRRLLEMLGTPLAEPPVGSPPAMLRLGTNEFAFPRSGVNDGWARSFQIGTRNIVDSEIPTTLLQQLPLREELQLDTAICERLPPYTGHPGEFVLIGRELQRSLPAPQADRLREISLQTIRHCCGKPALMEFREVADALSLSADQRVALTELLHLEARSLRWLLIAAIERKPEVRGDLDPAGDTRLDALLLPEQRRKLTEMLGHTCRGPLPAVSIKRTTVASRSLRGRLAPGVGSLADGLSAFQMDRLIERIEGISPEQAADLRNSAGRGISLQTQHLATILPPALLREYESLVMRGYAGSDGPASIFRLPLAIDVLTLSGEQQRRILEVLWDDTRRFLRLPLAELEDSIADLDEQTSEAIAAILTTNQRETLADLLNPQTGAQLPQDRTDHRSTESKPAADVRRTSYQARRCSASQLARSIRQRFRPEDRVQAIASSEDNTVFLTAPPEIFESVAELLPRFDQPGQMVVVEVVLAELADLVYPDLPERPGRGVLEGAQSGALSEVRRPDHSPRARSNDQVTRWKLTSLEKQLANQRTFQLQALVGDTALAGEDHAVAMAWGADKQPTGFWNPNFSSPELATRIQVTPRPSVDNLIELDLVLFQTRPRIPWDALEAGLSPEGPVSIHDVATDRFGTTLKLQPGGQILLHVLPENAAAPLRLIVGVKFQNTP